MIGSMFEACYKTGDLYLIQDKYRYGYWTHRSLRCSWVFLTEQVACYVTNNVLIWGGTFSYKRRAKWESLVDSWWIWLPFHAKLRNQGSISVNTSPLAISNTVDITSKWFCIQSELQHSAMVYSVLLKNCKKHINIKFTILTMWQ